MGSSESITSIDHRIRDHLEPLAVAINVCQGSGTRGDQVALIFGRLFKHYTDLKSSNPTEHTAVQALLDSLIKRWKAVDHEFFIVALVLNPWMKMKMFSANFLPYDMIPLLQRLYMRVFKLKSCDAEFTQRAYNYVASNAGFDVFGIEGGGWTADSLSQMMPASSLSSVLSPSLMYDSRKQTRNPVHAWALLGDVDPLARLAKLILTVICNSCDMERYFSECGDTKTAKRNKLPVEKMAQLATVGISIKRKHAETGEAVKRLKRSNCIAVHGERETDFSGRNLGLTVLPPEIEPDAAVDTCELESHDGGAAINDGDEVLERGPREWSAFQTQLLHELEHADSEPVSPSLD